MVQGHEHLDLEMKIAFDMDPDKEMVVDPLLPNFPESLPHTRFQKPITLAAPDSAGAQPAYCYVDVGWCLRRSAWTSGSGLGFGSAMSLNAYNC